MTVILMDFDRQTWSEASVARILRLRLNRRIRRLDVGLTHLKWSTFADSLNTAKNQAKIAEERAQRGSSIMDRFRAYKAGEDA